MCGCASGYELSDGGDSCQGIHDHVSVEMLLTCCLSTDDQMWMSVV